MAESSLDDGKSQIDEFTPEADRNDQMNHVTPDTRQPINSGVSVVDQSKANVVSKLKQPTKLPSQRGSSRLRSPSNGPSLPADYWLRIPVLEQKFRFKVPLNCHVSKTIMAALTHATKIVSTAQKKEAGGDYSIEFGLHMNDGPIDDTMSAHDYKHPHSPSNARLAHRHADCKTSVSCDCINYCSVTLALYAQSTLYWLGYLTITVTIFLLL